MNELVSIGSAKLRIIGLSPDRISTDSESRVPGKATFQGMDYQKTGMGERTTVIDAVTVPHVFGGLDSLAWLRVHHGRQDTVNMIRLGANYLGELAGRVIIRNLSVDEDRQHPRTRVGRNVSVSIELLHVGESL